MPDYDYIPGKIPPREFFDHVIGVTKFSGTEPQKVLIKVSKQQAPYVLSQPLHDSQEVVEEHPEYIIISLEVHDSPELRILLHGMNKQVEILEPKEMREYYRSIAEDIYNKYTG